jgi:filamentous hemagglutinin family protein
MKASYRKLIRRTFQQVVVYLTCASMVIPTPILAQTPAIVTDGRTQTSVTSNAAGTLTDVRTNTIKGINAYNSFERFNVPGGNTTNLHVPDAAKNLVNLVHGERTQIDGILNSYKDGRIGGNVFFLNPHGIAIGQSGIVNVGSLHLKTPTTDYMNQLIDKHGAISAVHEQMLFSGNVPISPSGLISVKGKVNAVEEISLTAGDVDLAAGSRLRAGHQVQVEFGDLVNVKNGKQWGNDLIETPEGKIRIVATNDVAVAGKVSTDATPGESAGQVEVNAGNDINVNTGAEISARGVGANSDGGEVVIFADRNSNLEAGAIVDVGAEKGKGGFLEFSAKDTVNIQGNGLFLDKNFY